MLKDHRSHFLFSTESSSLHFKVSQQVFSIDASALEFGPLDSQSRYVSFQRGS